MSIVLAGVGAVMCILAATNLQPSWMPQSIAVLIGSLYLVAALVLVEVKGMVER